MAYTMFAQWLGLVSVILSLGILFNLEYAHTAAKRMVEAEASYFTAGVLPVALGILILINADCLEFCWHLVVIFAGTAMLLAGMFRIMFVERWQKFVSDHIEYLPFLICLFGLMLGVVMIYAGFFAQLVSVNV